MRTHKLFTILASLAIMAGASSFVADAQYNGGNPGIVMAGSATPSQLPDKAKSFINKHFKDVQIRTCENYFAKGKIEVELANGVDLDFNSNGEIIEIDAPGRMLLSSAVVKDILPDKAYSRLEKDGLVNNVESIEFKKGKVYEVDLSIPDPDTYLFSPEGIFIAIED